MASVIPSGGLAARGRIIRRRHGRNVAAKSARDRFFERLLREFTSQLARSFARR